VSTPNLNVLLSASIATYDNQVANTPLLSNVNPGSLPFGAAASFRDDYLPAPVGGIALGLPTSPAYVVWVRNRHATASLGITLTFLVIGVQQVFIGPGDPFLWYNASKSSGLTALSLTGILATVPCEVYLAG